MFPSWLLPNQFWLTLPSETCRLTVSVSSAGPRDGVGPRYRQLPLALHLLSRIVADPVRARPGHDCSGTDSALPRKVSPFPLQTKEKERVCRNTGVDIDTINLVWSFGFFGYMIGSLGTSFIFKEYLKKDWAKLVFLSVTICVTGVGRAAPVSYWNI